LFILVEAPIVATQMTDPSIADWVEKGIAFVIAIALLYFFLRLMDKMINDVSKNLIDLIGKIDKLIAKVDEAKGIAEQAKTNLDSYRQSNTDCINNLKTEIISVKTVAEKNGDTLKLLDDGLDKALDGVTKIVHDVSGITGQMTTFFDTLLKMIERRDSKP
jgi:methyl-accepting chemotaxis protein